MQKYFISEEEMSSLSIMGDNFYHLKTVMRARVNDLIKISYNKDEYIAKVSLINKNDVKFEIVESVINNNELPIYVTLVQGMPKGDKLDDIIKMSTQLGISEIIPCMMKRSIIKLDMAKVANKTIRYNKIAKEASEQSDRAVVSKVYDPIKLKDIDFTKYDKCIVCFEEDAKQGECSNFKRVLKELKPGDRVCVVVGPEGGIDDDEINYLKNNNFINCAIGPRILRTETAIMYVLSAISYEVELC